jgi:hypothetical protein
MYIFDLGLLIISFCRRKRRSKRNFSPRLNPDIPESTGYQADDPEPRTQGVRQHLPHRVVFTPKENHSRKALAWILNEHLAPRSSLESKVKSHNQTICKNTV